MANKSNQ